jgi:hypothetical protein
MINCLIELDRFRISPSSTQDRASIRPGAVQQLRPTVSVRVVHRAAEVELDMVWVS